MLQRGQTAIRQRRFHLSLPLFALKERDLDEAIHRVGTSSSLTPLDYEQGHPLLNQLLRMFPVTFEEQSKKRWQRVKAGEDSNNIDRTQGNVQIKKAT